MTIGSRAEVLEVYLYEGYPPYSYEKDKKPKGLYVDLSKALLTKAGITHDIKVLPFKRALNFAKKGRGMISGILKNAERESYLHYSDRIFTEEIYVYVNSQSNLEYNSIEDLSGKTIGVNLGWYYGEAFKTAKKRGAFRVLDAREDEINWRRLAKGRVHLFLVDAISAKTSIKALGIEKEVKQSGKRFLEGPIFMAGARTDEVKKQIEKINVALQQLMQSGEYDKIIHAFIDNGK